MKNIYKRLFNVQKELSYIEKKGKNSFQKYNYVRGEDVIIQCKKALHKHDVLCLVTTLEKESYFHAGKMPFHEKVKIQVIFADIESGEEIRLEFWGVGVDSGDKGVYKAYTGALKYALMKSLMIPTEDDPEKDCGDILPQSQSAPEPNIINEENQIPDYILKLAKEKNISKSDISKSLIRYKNWAEVNDRLQAIK